MPALKAQTYSDLDVTVVDAASTDGTAEMVHRDFPWVELIDCETRVGIGEALNRGIKHSDGEYVVFDLNCDDLVTPTWLDSLITVLEQQPEVGVVCGKGFLGTPEETVAAPVLDSAGGRLIFGVPVPFGHKRRDGAAYSSLREVEYVGVLMTRRKIIDETGPLDEEFFFYGEDVDFCTRVRKAGYKVVMEPKATFWHRRSATIGEVSPTRLYYLSRSRGRLMLKHYKGIPRYLYPVMYALWVARYTRSIMVI